MRRPSRARARAGCARSRPSGRRPRGAPGRRRPRQAAPGARWPARAGRRPGTRGSRPGSTQCRPRDGAQVGGERLGGVGGGVGLRRIEEVAGDVDQVVPAAGACSGERAIRRERHARVGRQRRRAAEAVLQSAEHDRVGLQRGDVRGAEGERLGDAEAAGRAGEQHARRRVAARTAARPGWRGRSAGPAGRAWAGRRRGCRRGTGRRSAAGPAGSADRGRWRRRYPPAR